MIIYHYDPRLSFGLNGDFYLISLYLFPLFIPLLFSLRSHTFKSENGVSLGYCSSPMKLCYGYKEGWVEWIRLANLLFYYI